MLTLNERVAGVLGLAMAPARWVEARVVAGCFWRGEPVLYPRRPAKTTSITALIIGTGDRIGLMRPTKEAGACGGPHQPRHSKTRSWGKESEERILRPCPSHRPPIPLAAAPPSRGGHVPVDGPAGRLRHRSGCRAIREATGGDCCLYILGVARHNVWSKPDFSLSFT